jgi:hypothetical protein
MKLARIFALGINQRLSSTTDCKPSAMKTPCSSMSRSLVGKHIQYLPRGCRVHDPVIVLIGICFIRRLPARLCIHRCPNLVTESRHSSTTVIPCNQLRTIFLYRRWVQHNSNRCAEGLGRKVASELCSYYTGVACEEKSISILRVMLPRYRTMWPGDLAPNDSDL